MEPHDLAVRRADPGEGPPSYRLVDAHGRVGPANAFLEAVALRGLAPATQRTYAFALRHAWHWMMDRGRALDELTETHLLDFIGVLRRRRLAPRTINLALGVIRQCYAWRQGQPLPRSAVPPRRAMFGRPRDPLVPRPRARRQLRVMVPQRLIVPLDRQEVSRVFESLRTCRDLAIASLMLFCGLRSCEVLRLKVEDLDFDGETVRVRGKGNKERLLPLAPEVRHSLLTYLRVERPKSPHRALFLVLKGPSRGGPLTAAGLRTVFRHHRKRALVPQANPHRFRHTFAVDMVRAGMSLPALMRLMGHAHIDMTLNYVNLPAEDVRREFLAAVRKRASELRRG
jgi:site-specific recombinase XerD